MSRKLALLIIALLLNGLAYAQTNQQHAILKEVKYVQSKLKYSRYVLGGRVFDLRKGVYLVDCSGYVSRILERAIPKHFDTIKAYAHTALPNSLDYYNFVKHLGTHSDGGWSQVEKVSEMRPGDILIFRYKHLRRRISGHVMIVLSKPVAVGHHGAYRFRVADSTPFRHSDDTRHWHTGVGEGDLMLKTNSHGKPILYAWGVGRYWEREMLIDIARPA